MKQALFLLIIPAILYSCSGKPAADQPKTDITKIDFSSLLRP